MSPPTKSEISMCVLGWEWGGGGIGGGMNDTTHPVERKFRIREVIVDKIMRSVPLKKNSGGVSDSPSIHLSIQD